MKIDRRIAYVMAGVFLLLLVLGIVLGNNDKLINKIKRPGYNEIADTYSLTAKIEGETYHVNVQVEPMKIDLDNLQGYFDESYEIICRKILGKNASLTEVKTDLYFLDEIEAYGISASYRTNDYALINMDGHVNNRELDKEGKDCEITVELEYDGYFQEYVIPVHVYPPELTEEEIVVSEINDAISDENTRLDDEYLVLPDEVGGKSVVFIKEAESKIPIIILALLFILVFWYYKKFVVKRNLEKAREKELILDYGEIVSKLSLLMGAGMSSVAAFSKISKDYKRALKEGNCKSRFAYEEIVVTSNRISTGTPETEAFAMFGKACRLHCYIKLSSLLIQNSRKGGERFAETLKYEATQGFVERKAIAIQTGEEAGTKLLLPMGMMLCVVLIVIIVPAFMSF